jgi:hypothetical protein
MARLRAQERELREQAHAGDAAEPEALARPFTMPLPPYDCPRPRQ